MISWLITTVYVAAFQRGQPCFYIWAGPWENVSYVICEQQRRRSTCASAQSDQRFCCSLPRQNDTSSLYIRNFNSLAGLCSGAGQFVSCLVGDSRRHIFSWRGSSITLYFSWPVLNIQCLLIFLFLIKHHNVSYHPSFIIKYSVPNVWIIKLSQLMRLWYLSHRRPAKTRQSLHCSHTWSMEVDEGSDQISDI